MGDAVGNFSEVYNFVTPPAANTVDSLPHIFGVFGDMGTVRAHHVLASYLFTQYLRAHLW